MGKDMGVQDCPAALCEQLRFQINQYCKSSGIKQVLVAQGKDSWCFCYCDKAEAGQAELESMAGGADPCPSADCNTDPWLVEMCQGLAPGQPTLIKNRQGKYCSCECWGGALAPYKIATAGNKYRSLDEIPVGAFVKACGKEMEWVEMLVRFSSRPLQNSPQDAIRLTIGTSVMVVPTSHLFLTYQKKLLSAHKMIESLALMGSDGSPVLVDKIEAIKTRNAFQFIATVDSTPPDNLDYHLLDSQGVVSGDYAVQKAYEKKALAEELLAFSYAFMPENAPKLS